MLKVKVLADIVGVSSLEVDWVCVVVFVEGTVRNIAVGFVVLEEIEPEKVADRGAVFTGVLRLMPFELVCDVVNVIS